MRSTTADSISILLVDDEPDQLELAKLYLEEADATFRVMSVPHPLNALKTLRAHSFDCVVSDYLMPALDGVALCTEVRKVSSVPFILYTGRGSEEVAEKAFEAGVDDYIRKESTPSHFQVLARRIRHAVEGYRAEEALRASDEMLHFVLMREGSLKADKMEEQRRTGIGLIGDVPWGTHFCQFYQTREDLADILVPYFRAGLENNEFCMWVTAEPLNEEEAKRAMEAALPDLSRYLKSGQIEILSYKDWYVRDGGFDADRVLSGWVSKLEDALKNGYSGLRLTGNTFWLEKGDWRAFTDYEEMVNSVIGKHRMIAICTYSLDKCNASEIVDVVKNHQFALIKRSGIWELIESSEYKKMREALLLSEERYRTLFETMTEGFSLDEIIYDEQGKPCDLRYLAVNPAFERQTGLKAADILERTTRELFPDAEPIWFERFGKVVLTGEPMHFEEWFGPLGRCFDVRAFRTEPGRFGVVFMDITERKKAEEALRESEIRMSRAEEIAHLGSWELDLRTNNLSWSDEVYRIFGLKPQEFGATYEAFLEAVHPDDRAAVDAAYSGSLREGKDSYEIEHRIVRKSTGEVRVVQEKCQHIRDETGRIIRSIGMVHDITERKRAEEQIQESNERLRESNAELDSINEELMASTQELAATNKRLEDANNELAIINEELQSAEEELKATNKELSSSNEELITLNEELEVSKTKVDEYASNLEEMVEERTWELKRGEEDLQNAYSYTRSLIEASMDPLVTISPEGKITDVNYATELVTGVPRERLIGSDFSDYFTEPDRAREGYRLAFRDGSVRDFPLAIRHASGKVTDVLYNAIVYRNKAGEVQGVFAAARDLTEKKMMEEKLLQTEKIESVSRIGASIAHDLRGPLSTISQAAAMLKKNPERTDRMISMIQENTERCMRMMDEFRAGTRDITVQPKKINLSSLIKKTMEEVKMHESVKAEVKLREGLESVKLDPEIFLRVLTNLVTNAVEAMPEGGTVTVEAGMEGREITLSVSDTGKGIPADAQTRLFQPLFTTKPNGMGLGLYYMKRAVEAHGGRIGYETGDDGTTFTVKIPSE